MLIFEPLSIGKTNLPYLVNTTENHPGPNCIDSLLLQTIIPGVCTPFFTHYDVQVIWPPGSGVCRPNSS
jgi:hypothetical protein